MLPVIAQEIIVAERSGRVSKSRASRRCRTSQPKVRSTAHLRGSGANPFWSGSFGTTAKLMPAAAACPGNPVLYPPPAPPAVTDGWLAASRAATSLPPLVSWTDAAVITTASSRPRVSVAMCCIRPFVRFPAAYPWLASGTFDDVVTTRASMIAAVGSADRPAFSRTLARSRSWIASVGPSFSRFAEWMAPVRYGGKSCGSRCHAHPARFTYKIAFAYARRQDWPGRRMQCICVPSRGAGARVKLVRVFHLGHPGRDHELSASAALPAGGRAGLRGRPPRGRPPGAGLEPAVQWRRGVRGHRRPAARRPDHRTPPGRL